MKPVIIRSDKDNNPIVTFDELSKLLNDAYEAGYKDGRNSVVPVSIYPSSWWQVPSLSGNTFTTENTVTTTLLSENEERK